MHNQGENSSFLLITVIDLVLCFSLAFCCKEFLYCIKECNVKG